MQNNEDKCLPWVPQTFMFTCQHCDTFQKITAVLHVES